MKTHFRSTRHSLILLACATALGSAAAIADEPVPTDATKAEKMEKAAWENPSAPAKIDPQMKVVLDKFDTLGAKPITELDAKDARKQPSIADAVKKVMKDQGKSQEKVDTVDNVTIKLSSGEVKGRIYRPEGDGPFPVILYFHGGGFVIADLDTYDATPRALANAAHALVISADYHQAPEFKFPAAVNDAYGAYVWTMENAGRYKGDSKKIAVVGESAGGNLAVNVSMAAMEKNTQMPVHEVLVYPMAGTSYDSMSYKEHANAEPLSGPAVKWFVDQYTSNGENAKDPKIALLEAKSFKGMPSTTIITAEIDPLRCDGEDLAKRMKDDGVQVSYKCYEGVTHEFFGMGAVVDKAKEAVDMAARNLKAAFDGNQIDTAKVGESGR